MAHIRRISFHQGIIFTLLLLLTGCAAATLREAQDHFNRGADLELAQQSSVPSGAAPIASAVGSYQAAHQTVEDVLANRAGELRGDGLYGNALILRALAEWRLADLTGRNDPWGAALNETHRTLLAEHQAGTITLGTRDLVLMHALPGLREHDKALRAASYDEAERLFRSAINVLDGALLETTPPPGHPIRNYIRFAQLSSCRAWQQRAYAAFENNLPQVTAENEQIHAVAEPIIAKLRQRERGDELLKDAIQSWEFRLGL
jgi:hypothetical protein